MDTALLIVQGAGVLVSIAMFTYSVMNALPGKFVAMWFVAISLWSGIFLANPLIR